MAGCRSKARNHRLALQRKVPESEGQGAGSEGCMRDADAVLSRDSLGLAAGLLPGLMAEASLEAAWRCCLRLDEELAAAAAAEDALAGGANRRRTPSEEKPLLLLIPVIENSIACAYITEYTMRLWFSIDLKIVCC